MLSVLTELDRQDVSEGEPSGASLELIGPSFPQTPLPVCRPGGVGEGERAGLKKRCSSYAGDEGSFVLRSLAPCDFVIPPVPH